MPADAVIIGSGPAAVASAWPLIEAGRSVLMLDAADHPVPDPPVSDLDRFRRSGEGWRHAFGDDLGGLALGRDLSPKFATRIGQTVLAAESDSPSVRARDFIATRSLTAGGLSKLWGAFATAFDDRDLRNFPISKDDLIESYRVIAARIGLSGSEDDLAAFHGAGLPMQPPDWLSPIGRQLIERYKERPRTDGFILGLARNAVSTQTMDGRDACNRCGLCLYGCGRKAIYDSTQDLARLSSKPNFHYRGASRATRLLALGTKEQAVEIATVAGRATVGASALILAAGTLNSTALALGASGSAGTRLRLLANPVAAIAFLVPSFLGTPLPASGFSLGQLSYRLEIEGGSDYATGVFYAADTLPFSTLADKIPFSRRAALRLSQFLATSVVIATCYLPGRFSENHLSLAISTGREEALEITGEITVSARRALEHAAKRLSRAMRGYGAFAIPRSLSILMPGADGHLAGTLPMVREGGPLTCTPEGALRPWKNVFVVDGSSLSDLPAKHCTFTIMANADRIGRIVARRFASAATNG